MSLFLILLPFGASVSSGLGKLLISSSHLFFGLPTALHVLIFGAEARTPFCCFPCPIVPLVSTLFSSPVATSFFCVFQSKTGFGLSSSVLLLRLCFSLSIRSILLFQFLLCQFLHLCHSPRRSRCLGRNLCWSCFPLQFRLRSFVAFFFFFFIPHPSRSQVVCHSLVLFPPCCLAFSSCTFFWFGL